MEQVGLVGIWRVTGSTQLLKFAVSNSVGLIARLVVTRLSCCCKMSGKSSQQQCGKEIYKLQWGLTFSQ
eukprot:1160060-Pelagomonas_calceolata.AAC.1